MSREVRTRLFQLCRVAAFAIAGSLLPPTVALAQDAPSLPGGASSLLETFGDWRVACQIVETTKRCALSQQQARQDGQRVLAIELVTSPNNTTGTIVLPFGLLLDAGVVLQIDEHPALELQNFRTCLPAGCIVPPTLDEAQINALRAGTTLELTAKSSDTEQDVELDISLAGFSAAIDRSRALIES